MDNSLQSSNGNPYRTVAGVPGKRAKDSKAVLLERNFRNRFFQKFERPQFLKLLPNIEERWKFETCLVLAAGDRKRCRKYFSDFFLPMTQVFKFLGSYLG